ncbi:hypothetical protein D1007_22006 [Hordeum vulgare]|nr:hypothetical protein D1007_22006 [Hordeum vulgare]
MPERLYQNEQEIRTRRAARIAVGRPSHSPKLEQEEKDQAETDFAVAQANEMAEQQAILEFTKDDAYVKANQRFIRQELAGTGALFNKVEAEVAVKVPELQLSPMYPMPSMEIMNISDED